MRPLARAFEARFLGWLPKATYPIRVGTHGSSAFALALAWRYAPFAADPGFGEALAEAARAGSRRTPTCGRWSRAAPISSRRP